VATGGAAVVICCAEWHCLCCVPIAARVVIQELPWGRPGVFAAVLFTQQPQWDSVGVGLLGLMNVPHDS
jgi:hypothetical protein